MHVGIVSPCSSGPLADLLPQFGGVDVGCGAHFMTTLVRALIVRGHLVSVITLSPQVAERKIMKGSRLAFYVYPMRTHKRMRDFYKLERRGIKDGILSAKPDVLHAHWTYEFALACLETVLPTIVTSHDNAVQVLRYTRDLYRLGRLYLQIKVVREARRLTAVSPYLADYLQRICKTKIEVVPNPVELPKSKEDENVRLFSDRVRIATVLNGWQNLKNPKKGLIAFDLVRRKQPDAELFMYGIDYEEGGPAARWAARNKLDRNVHFCGTVSRDALQEQLATMSILLHPSLEEACPMALLEAMAVGLPIVAGIKAGGVPWVLDGGRAGFLTDVTNPEKIAETLHACIDQNEVREIRRRKAQERVREVFSPGSVAQLYERIYEKSLAS